MKRYFGCHVSAAGGLVQALRRGEALGVNTIQIHPTPPQRWNFKPFPPGVETELLQARPASSVEKIFLHAVYLINLAMTDPVKRGHAARSLEHYLELNDRIGGQGVVFHVGSNKDQPSEEEGLRQAADEIDGILEKSRGTGRLLLEVSAGSGKIIGDRMAELRTIYDLCSGQDRLGFALDTQHLWASGYDLAGNLEGVVREIEEVFGVDKVAAIHLNDSKTAMGSRVDRHENLGAGTIGLAALGRFVNHPRLAEIPVMLETPGLQEPATAAAEVQALRGLLHL